MLFVGHTRFSLLQPDSGAWRASNGSRFSSHEDYRDYLFDPRRLGERTQIFVGEVLPQLAEGVRSHRVRHVVSYPVDLPEPFRSELEAAAERYPFVVLDRQGPDGWSRSPMDVARSELAADGGMFGFYRLDDDDLLTADYFDRMAAYVTEANTGFMVSFGAGITGLRTAEGYFNLRRCHYPMLAIGLLGCAGCIRGVGSRPRSARPTHARTSRTR
ncbi:hypothetical protein C8046_09635 [Serinibacter arcticus]|uniref:Rhamnosyl transferase n=1 Tax=Serinibacter arcticus TaxID=1655435 RepID=A0A2U1ZV77_9MICO|nr:glycosyltransferase [Serinibacter arcticus]PWD50874.1 hypothetical protein C8046_09635 [Serinibacter arcticus]